VDPRDKRGEDESLYFNVMAGRSAGHPRLAAGTLPDGAELDGLRYPQHFVVNILFV
jgi:hypothetical protein